MEWSGNIPKECELCRKKIELAFVDGLTKYNTWAIMCLSCHRQEGVGFGNGKGQKYRKDLQSGKFMKTKG